MPLDPIKLDHALVAADALVARLDAKKPTTGMIPYRPPLRQHDKPDERQGTKRAVENIVGTGRQAAKPAVKTAVTTSDPGRNAARILVEELTKVRAKIQAAQQSQVTARKEAPVPKGGKIDAAGAVLRGNQAFYNGIVIRPGGTYTPRKGGRALVFECDSVEWLDKRGLFGTTNRLIAVGKVHYLGSRHAGDVVANKFYYVTDLLEAPAMLNPEGRKFTREGIF